MSNLKEAIEKFKDAKVAVIGDIMLDHYTFGEVERVSPEASVPIVVEKSEKFMLGGAANVANNLAALGANVSLAGTVGDDKAGALVMRLLKEKGIGTEAIVTLAHRPTIEKHRIISGENHQLLRLDREKRDNLTLQEEERCYALMVPIIKKCDAIIFSDYAKGFFREPFTQKIIAFAKAEKKIMLADFNPKHKKYFLGVDVVSPNFKEARELTGLYECEVEMIGPQIVRELDVHAVVTLGGEGMSLFRREDASHYHVPGKKIRVFDVSGAGDTSIAVLALGVVAGLDLADATMLANEAGTIVVQKPGTATLSREELASALESDNHVEN
jgi:rfaE bifunctional protein kinase chain/domain